MGSRLGVGWVLPSNVINCCNFTGKLALGEGRDAPGSKSVLQISVCIASKQVDEGEKQVDKGDRLAVIIRRNSNKFVLTMREIETL